MNPEDGCGNGLKVIWGWLKWLAAFTILAWLIYQNRDGWHRLAERSVHWLALGLALALAGAGVLLSFYRWHLLLRAQGFPHALRDTFRIGLVGYVVPLIGFGALGGDVAKSILIARDEPARRTLAIATILFDRALGMLSLFMIGAGSALVLSSLVARSIELQAFATVFAAGSAAGLLALLLLLKRTPHPLLRGEGQLPSGIARAPIIGKRIGELIDGIVLYQQHRRIVAAAVGVGVLGNACGLSAFYFCALGIGVAEAAPTWPVHLLVMPGTVVAEVLAPLPAGIGALEAATQYCYAVAHRAITAPVTTAFAAEAGFLTALVFRFVTLVISAAGIVSFIATGPSPLSPLPLGERGEGVRGNDLRTQLIASPPTPLPQGERG